jgi:putative transposase
MLIDRQDQQFSVRQQCELLGINRSSLYYQPTGESEENLMLMRLLDEQYTRTPFYGVRKMEAYLRSLGHEVNHKRVRRLLREMGLEAIYQKPNTSKPNPEHKVFPYLLRGLTIDRCDQVWSTDITYIRLKGGFVYLMAIIDWYSRYVLAWSLSTTLDADFCIATLVALLERRSCEIFNTDQGAQFTTPFYNIFVERLWRSVKYEHVYLQDILTVQQAWLGLRDYFLFYNYERFHQSLDNKPPAEIYYAGRQSKIIQPTTFYQPYSILI